jgi:diguanylate cyclase (GGDEF)-like protein/PAS domain S-box-containing protein
MDTLVQLVFEAAWIQALWQRLIEVGAMTISGDKGWFGRAVLSAVILMSATAGAILHRLFANSRFLARKGEVVSGELAMLRAVIANLPDTIFVKDAKSRFLMANLAAAKNVGANSGAEVLGKTDFDFFPRKTAEVFFENEREVLESGLPQVSKEESITDAKGETRYLLTTKVPFINFAGEIVGLIGIGRNVTALKAVEAELERARDELKFKASHDSLTRLLNHEAILEQLEHELARSARDHRPMAVMLADLDGFKGINDTYGHLVGDEVLREVSCLLQNRVRSYDLIGRYGGEEFLIVLSSCSTADVAMARAEQLRSDLAISSILTARGPISTTMSIGVLVTDDEQPASVLQVIHDVDAALYAAKQGGRNCCCFATPAVEIAADWN